MQESQSFLMCMGDWLNPSEIIGQMCIMHIKNYPLNGREKPSYMKMYHYGMLIPSGKVFSNITLQDDAKDTMSINSLSIDPSVDLSNDDGNNMTEE